MAPTLKSQQDLLQGSEWRSLLILDAARADYVRAKWGRFQTVKALGGITHTWCRRFWQLQTIPMMYFSANPVTTVVAKRVRARHVQMVEVWRDKWRDFGKNGQRLGSVHPEDVNKAVKAALGGTRKPGVRIVVHYLQPHTPYVGKVRLPVPIGNLMDGLTGKGRDKDMLPEVLKGTFSWDEVREAYRANLDLVMPYAIELAKWLGHQFGEPTIITSDHGEALGDMHGSAGPFWGHAGIPYSLIRDVPWWEG